MKIFKIEINANELSVACDIVAKRLKMRGLSEGDGGFLLTLELDKNFISDSYRIIGNDSHITVIADSINNILAGAGRFLYTSLFTKDGIIPSKIRGITTPDCRYRCVYTATHFHTFYYSAPIEKVFEYIEDLALMGINQLLHPVPGINLNMSNKKAVDEAYDRCEKVMKMATSIGIGLIHGAPTSCTFFDIPEEAKATPIPNVLARGNGGHKVCPSTKKGQEILDAQNRLGLTEMKKRGIAVNYLTVFPYDEGGCGCEKCKPWGGNGYIRAAKRALEVAREYFPECKLIVATWLFDEEEWELLSKSLEQEKWADIIMADSHTTFPRYPIDNRVPGDLPLIAFPEISMWGLWPWGGYGASFFPERYTKIWRATEGKLQGGRMYSEGIYEDMNKYVVSGLYRDYNNDPDAAVAEYGAYSFGCTQTEKFVEMVKCIEKNHVLNAENCMRKVFMTADKNHADTALSERAWELAQELDATLPEWGKKTWRWRLIYIRAFIDLHRYRNERLHENPEVLKFMEELSEIYHCIKNYKISDDPYHFKLRPPVPVYDENFNIDDYSNINSIRDAYKIGLIVNGKNAVSDGILDDSSGVGV